MNKKPTQKESIQWIKENILNRPCPMSKKEGIIIHVPNIDISLFDEYIIFAIEIIKNSEQQLFDKKNVEDLFIEIMLSLKGGFFADFQEHFNTFLKEVEPFTKEKDNEDK